jgi:hypothetical protein
MNIGCYDPNPSGYAGYSSTIKVGLNEETEINALIPVERVCGFTLLLKDGKTTEVLVENVDFIRRLWQKPIKVGDIIYVRWLGCAVVIDSNETELLVSCEGARSWVRKSESEVALATPAQKAQKMAEIQAKIDKLQKYKEAFNA